jgi:GNAT superfamily N-acetyltransferase
VIIDEARVGEADVLTQLALASKRYWGYDEDFMERCRRELMVSERDIETRHVFVARDAERALGFYLLLPIDDSCVELDMLFVEPQSIGDGVGGALLRHAAMLARGEGALALRITADPFAVPFYEHLGAVLVGSSVSASTGRSLPVYELAL